MSDTDLLLQIKFLLLNEAILQIPLLTDSMFLTSNYNHKEKYQINWEIMGFATSDLWQEGPVSCWPEYCEVLSRHFPAETRAALTGDMAHPAKVMHF